MSSLASNIIDERFVPPLQTSQAEALSLQCDIWRPTLGEVISVTSGPEGGVLTVKCCPGGKHSRAFMSLFAFPLFPLRSLSNLLVGEVGVPLGSSVALHVHQWHHMGSGCQGLLCLEHEHST